eukprot:NODE_276_length_1701_cov_300.462470_g202_i0.p3 GENE.NODE_276_length_1701_cov_300.462470_g202_i0~~NODE_276_length_1701_cov_300.462470_g202_i0.p3  ORF type:complete len:223 (-),score=125.93 NODE_276_length_1701_cov_300.462470_g202_i0:455-1123(-)
MKMQNRRQEDISKVQAAKLDEQQRILQMQTVAIETERRQKAELEQLLTEYYMEQKEEQSRKEEQDREDKKRQIRLDAQQYNEHQQRIIQARKLKEKEEEAEFRRQMMDKFAEDDRIDQMNALERNRKKAEHHREIQRLIEQKKLLREAERQREMHERQKDAELAEFTQQVVERERLNLLREHGIKLLAHLPKGVIQPGDFEKLGFSPEEARELELASKDPAL